MAHGKRLAWVGLWLLAACGDDGETVRGSLGRADGGLAMREASASRADAGGTRRGDQAGAADQSGARGRRSPLSCPARPDTEVTCGGEVCPTSARHENDPCFVPCCVMFEGKERCGFRGTSALTTECLLPAVEDPSCNDAPQFFGCCEPTRHVCGIIAGVLPGCQTKVSFATLPDPPKACGPDAHDAGISDTDAGR